MWIPLFDLPWSDLLKFAEGIVTIVAVWYSRRAARDARATKNAVGGSIPSKTLRSMLAMFRRRKHAGRVEVVQKDAFQSLTLDEKVDMLKDNLEMLWVRQGVETTQITERLDEVAPPRKRH